MTPVSTQLDRHSTRAPTAPDRDEVRDDKDRVTCHVSGNFT